MDIRQAGEYESAVEQLEERLEQAVAGHHLVEVMAVDDQQLPDLPLVFEADPPRVRQQEVAVVITAHPDHRAAVRLGDEAPQNGVVLGAKGLARIVDNVPVQDQRRLEGQFVQPGEELGVAEVPVPEMEVADDEGYRGGHRFAASRSSFEIGVTRPSGSQPGRS